MKKVISIKLKTCALLLATILTGSAFIGCQDEVDESNRYTFTGDLISSYLEKDPEQFSHFVYILSKASLGNKNQSSLLETLSSYGAYTCFAPTNDAIERFLAEKYNIWATSVENNRNDPTAPIEETGITSPNLEDLSIEKCNEIAKNHVIEKEYKRVDFGGELPVRSMNFRPISTRSDSFDIVTGDRVYCVGAKNAEAIGEEVSTYNGTIHILKDVLDPSTKNIADILNEADGLSIFREALTKTGLNKLLEKRVRDEAYDKDLVKEKALQNRNEKAFYPETSFDGFTLLVEPNDVLVNPNNNSFGIAITDVNKLIEFAEKAYGSEPGFEEVYDHPKNALFKFISYHILDRTLTKEKKAEGNEGNASGNWFMYNFNRNGFNAKINMSHDKNWHDYFETYLPYDEWTYTDEELKAVRSGDVDEGCMIKATQLKGNTFNIMLNYCNTAPSEKMSYHTNITVYSHDEAKNKWPESISHSKLAPTNGHIQYIDKILVYDEDEMVSNIINERMRWDVMSLFPELTTNLVRWDTENTFYYIPAGRTGDPAERQFSKRLRALAETTHIVYLTPCPTYNGGYTNYQGDEFLMEGIFDAEMRIPHVPFGTYEIRVGFCMSDKRGVIQFYLDNEICGIPTDMRLNDINKNRMGWFSDEKDGLSADDIITKEKAMRNRGYMKGPGSIVVDNTQQIPMRECDNAFRRIITTNLELTPKKEGHWLRVKNVTQTGTETREYNHDYLEIVPKNIYNNPSLPEDRD